MATQPIPPSGQHSRTLTSLLQGSDSLGPRAHSVPVEDHPSLRPLIVSEALEETHPQGLAVPPLQHSSSDPIGDAQQQKQLARELKAFDPYACLSPPPMATVAAGISPIQEQTSPTSDVAPASASASAAAASDAGSASSSVSSSSSRSSSLRVEAHQSVNNYSSAALSSGSFTAISVSPVPSLTPGGQHVASTPVATPPQPQPYAPPVDSSAAKMEQGLDFFSGASTTSDASVAGADSTVALRTMSVDVATSTPTHAAHDDASSARSALMPGLGRLSISSPSVSLHTPMVHPSPGSSHDGLSTRSAVTFRDVDTTIDSLGRVTHTRQQRGSSIGGPEHSPSAVRFNDGGNDTPSVNHRVPGTAYAAGDLESGHHRMPSAGLNSPSLPQSSIGSRGGSPAEVMSPTHGQDSPLPPVVSALMAAQKMAGTIPGTTLAMPARSQQGRLIYIVGDASGAGKTSVAMGLLHLFLKRGYKPSDLGYIKPCTQCEDVQLISKYCEKMGIAHQGIGPVIFYAGFTAEVIDGKAESVDVRRSRIQKAVNKMAEGKKWVLVDGVGYAAVGSVAGVSNAEVASLLNAPVLVIGRPGIGNAIDSMNFILGYFEKFHVRMVGACWNRLPPKHSYHSYEQCKHYVNKYFREVRQGVISTYGHIPLVDMPQAAKAAAAAADPASPPAEELTCVLRPAKTDLLMNEQEEAFVKQFLAVMEREFDIELLLADLNRYYQAHRVQLVSVV